MPENNEIIDNDICMRCVHFWGINNCYAFPNGIPDEIMHGDNDHSKPLPGQTNDIIFKEIEDANI